MESSIANEEFFDICDVNGKPTGVIKSRRKVHRDGDIHRTAHVWIVRVTNNSYDVLLQKRSSNKDSHPGCYDISSAGHIPAGYDYLESAVRELEEELGIIANTKDLKEIGLHYGEINEIFWGEEFHDKRVSKVYIYDKDIDINRLKLQKEEVEEVIWLNYYDALKGIEEGTLNHCIKISEFKMLGEFINSIPEK